MRSSQLFLNNSQILQENACVHFLIKLQAWNFVKKGLQHSSFPVKFGKFFRTTILKNICERLLLTHLSLIFSLYRSQSNRFCSLYSIDLLQYNNNNWSQMTQTTPTIEWCGSGCCYVNNRERFPIQKNYKWLCKSTIFGIVNQSTVYQSLYSQKQSC